MRKMRWVLVAAAVAAAAAAAAGTCVDGACHKAQTSVRFLHGPLGAEVTGNPGCVTCHVSAGAPCRAGAKGVFKLVSAKDILCTSCHEKSTGTDHSSRESDCLECHDPHGSDQNVNLLR